MDERQCIRREMAAADAIRATSDKRIGSLGEAIRSDLHDKLIHHPYFGQTPGQYGAPQQDPETQESEPPVREREIKR